MSRKAMASVRLAVAAAIMVAVSATAIETAGRVTLSPLNFFGYFTIQSNLIACGVLIFAAVVAFRAGPNPATLDAALELVRASATTYMVVVGLVYAVLLAPLGVAGGVPLPWANVVLHIVTPLYLVVDWVFVGDRGRLPFSRLWVVALYPLVWCVVVLVRGATDGWVPYPFLDPAQGYPTVLTYVAIIAGTVLVVGALVFGASRFPGVVARATR